MPDPRGLPVSSTAIVATATVALAASALATATVALAASALAAFATGDLLYRHLRPLHRRYERAELHSLAQLRRNAVGPLRRITATTRRAPSRRLRLPLKGP